MHLSNSTLLLSLSIGSKGRLEDLRWLESMLIFISVDLKLERIGVDGVVITFVGK